MVIRLEGIMTVKVGLLSKGQRQTLTLLMVTYVVRDAIAYDNKFIVINSRRVIYDVIMKRRSGSLWSCFSPSPRRQSARNL